MAKFTRPLVMSTSLNHYGSLKDGPPSFSQSFVPALRWRGWRCWGTLRMPQDAIRVYRYKQLPFRGMHFFLIQPHLFGKTLLSLFLSVNLCLFRISTSLKRIICQEPHMYSLNGIFSPEVSLWKILMFSHFYYTTQPPNRLDPTCCPQKVEFPLATGGCVRNAALRRPPALLDFFLVEVSGDEILALDQSGWNHLFSYQAQVCFQKLMNGWLPKLFTPPEKKQYAHNPINGGHPHMVQLWGNCNGRTTAGAAEPLDRGFVWWNRWNLQQNNLVFRSIEMSKSSWQYGKKCGSVFKFLWWNISLVEQILR